MRHPPIAARLLPAMLAIAVLPLAAQRRGAPAPGTPASIAAHDSSAGRGPLGTEGYIAPPAKIAALVTAPRENNFIYTAPSPGTRKYLLHTISDGAPTLERLGKAHYNLGGFQVDNAGNRARTMTTNSRVGFEVYDWAGGKTVKIDVPAGARVGTATFSPDGNTLGFIAEFPNSTQIYLAEPGTGKSRPLTSASLLATNVQNFEWTGDGKSILAVMVPDNRGAEPRDSLIAHEPLVRLNEDRKLHTEVYPSLLGSPHEKALLEYYTTGQLVLIDLKTRAVRKIGVPGMIQRLDAAPSAKYFRVTYVDKPFSYIIPVSSFGSSEVVIDETGKVLTRLSSRVLRENQDTTPADTTGGRGGGRGAGANAADTGRRNFAWDPTDPALIYVQMQPYAPGQRPDTSIKRKDRVIEWMAPFDSTGTSSKTLYETDAHISSVAFSDNGRIMFVSQTGTGQPSEVAVYFDEANKVYPVITPRPGGAGRGAGGRGGAGGAGGGGGAGRGGAAGAGAGALLTRPGSHGDAVVMISPDGKYVYTSTAENGAGGRGRGAATDSTTPKPFVDRIEIKTGTRDRVYESQSAIPETIVSALDDSFDRLLVDRQSAKVVPQSFIVDSKTHEARQITSNTDVMPEMAGLIKKTVYATRADGHHFKIVVTLPADWKPGTRLPALFWFYPAEFASQDAYDHPAGRGGAPAAATTDRFPTYGPRTMSYITFAGYALVEPDTPIFAQNGQLPNDHYVDDLRDDLYATIEALDTLGLVDRNRLAIGGHSYGAFSTANAMVHTPYFKAGIAGDGDYNRTLTPTGFQNERRDLWQGRETYLDMSPFLYADHLNGALLMYHSLEDQNVGTAPINSIRMFHALQSLGKTTALFMYPYEDHGPVARETNLDQWARWVAWLDKYVKNAGSTPTP
jgi:dipeptidyl aminopeptidase/acylaminoacyl peptidase